MIVPAWLWIATIAGLLLLIALDLVIVDRKPHEVTTGEAARWVAFYVSCAVVFGIGLWAWAGHDIGVQFFTGYIMEYSLSVDNLFVFMLIMASFKVPALHQHRVLLVGIVLALIMRGVFIALGAAMIEQFSWVFFVFGAILVWTAISMLRGGEQDEYHENAVVRRARKMFPVTDGFVGNKMFLKRDGKRWITPLFVVIVAIGSADLLFAVDSIPAIFGITQEAFIVFTANAFALMGLRQLYFLVGGLMDRLVYLNYGLAVILSFIGAKLFLHAAHEQGWVGDDFEIGNWLSLGVIVTVLAVTTAVSLLKSKRDDRKAAEELREREPQPSRT